MGVRRGVVAAVWAGLVLAACGSGGVSKAQFIARADVICRDSSSQLRAREATARTLATVVPVIDREVRELTDLPQPSQDRRLLRRYLSAMRTSLAGWRQLAAVMAAGARNAAALSAAQARVASAAPEQLARRYGLGACSAAGATAG